MSGTESNVPWALAQGGQTSYKGSGSKYLRLVGHRLFPLIIKATTYRGVSFTSQGRAGDRVPSSSGLSEAEGLGLKAAAAGARGEWTRDNSPAVSGVLLPCPEPRSALGSALGGYPGPGVLEILTLLLEKYGVK